MALPSTPFSPDRKETKTITTAYSPLKKSKRKRRSLSIKEPFSSVDEVPDFHDPFSDLNLFLFKHLKRALPGLDFPKRWSLKLQDGLIKAIAPEFRKKFPLYRLGVTALKKAFEKLLSFSEVVEHEKEAFSQDGKLRISFLIKENLKQFQYFTPPSYLQPYHLAHQLAMKIGECLAVVDGRRPKIDILAKTVWSILRHLLKGIHPKETKSPYDDYDGMDQLIVKLILENTTKDSTISEHDLKLAVKETIHYLNGLPSFSSLDHMHASIATLTAEKLYASAPLLTPFPTPQRQAALAFLKKHILACRTASPSTERSEIALRTAALYTLASNLPHDLSEQQIKAGVKALYPTPKKSRPRLGQSVYAFLAAELVLTHAKSQDDIADKLVLAYKEATKLPIIEEHDLLEILIWKQLGESEALLNTLSYPIGQRIEEEIANLLLDNPNQSFAHLVSHTVSFFKKIKGLSINESSEKIEGKIRIWTLQSDMLQRWIRLDENTPLMKQIKKIWNSLSKRDASFSHETLIQAVSKAYLKQYPKMALYASHLPRRITTLYKYCFFSCFGKPEESSLDRLIAWHTITLKEFAPSLSQKELNSQLEEILSKRVPLIPSSLITGA